MLTIMSPDVESVTRTDAGLASQLRVSVARLARRLRNERDPENSLGVGSISVLGVLLRHGEQTIGQLAAHERVQPPSMNRTVNCLVEAGYAERSPAPDDGRRVTVSITDAGRTVVQETRRQRNAWLSLRLDELTAAERATLGEAAALLGRMAAA